MKIEEDGKVEEKKYEEKEELGRKEPEGRGSLWRKRSRTETEGE